MENWNLPELFHFTFGYSLLNKDHLSGITPLVGSDLLMPVLQYCGFGILIFLSYKTGRDGIIV